MGFDPEAWLREQKKIGERWYRRTPADIEAAKRAAEQVGREVWNNGTRFGTDVVAKTQQQLRELGKTAQRVAPKVAADIADGFMGDPNRREIAKTVDAVSKLKPLTPQEAEVRVKAGLRGASDGATFGLGDKVSAAANSGKPFAEGWGERYHANMQGERAQDSFDQEKLPLLAERRTIGRRGGSHDRDGANSRRHA